MDDDQENWSRIVFRLQCLPSNIEAPRDAAKLLSEALGDVRPDSIHVFSVARTLNYWESPRSKVATLMFDTVPSIVRTNGADRQWSIPNTRLLLDANFLGMTPLNEVDTGSHTVDCIAVSGLASHPFGSWQQKGSDKTYMWIRDALPRDIPGMRTVVYGYDTKLENSESFQLIPDLAQSLINQLQTYGWSASSAKPILLLAHSLGGLVVKEAMVQLESSPNEVYRGLLSNIRGVIFFGVPNLGMEQTHIRIITKNNANEALVDDLARNSNYLRRLDKSFSSSSIQNHVQTFWAYETAESPTAQKLIDGRVRRYGPPAVLVGRESATCRYVVTNPSITFPINMNHSEMVKFGKESPYYHTVVSKLLNIVLVPDPSISASHAGVRPLHTLDEPGNSISDFLQDEDYLAPSALSLASRLSVAAKAFVHRAGLTKTEISKFQVVDFEILKDSIRKIQEDHEKTDNLMDMIRLESFLVSMKQFVDVVRHLDDDVTVLFILWGSMRFTLVTAAAFPEALNSLLDAYQNIGDQCPSFVGIQKLISTRPFMKDVLVAVYEDVLEFHREAIRCFKQRQWKQLFASAWRELAPRIEHITKNMGRNRRLIESSPNLSRFEEVQNARDSSIRDFESRKRDQENQRLRDVKQWLSPFGCEVEQDRHRTIRSICANSGGWLFEHPKFERWFSPDHCSTPLLWLSGIPGAGKTILASVIIDAARNIEGATVLFFYCKYDDEARNSFVSMSRSLLSQILAQHPHLLPYLHEKVSMSPDTILSSPMIARETMRIALRSTSKTYIVIDGLDECSRDERKEISSRLVEVVESLPPTDIGAIRCLFVSQDDGIARKDLGRLPSLKITTENESDLKAFATVRHKEIEAKFGELRAKDCHIANIICARAKGMFIFAELMSRYLRDQPNLTALLHELEPSNLPVKLDHVYERIMYRIIDSRGPQYKAQILEVLGWIVSAKRPLRWREIQGAICIDIDQQSVDWNRKLIDSPKDLFGSLVELQSDDTIELIHQTAHDYLIRSEVIKSRDADYSLVMLSLAYLAFPHLRVNCSDEEITDELIQGAYAFYDYASVCWSIHLQTWMTKPDIRHGNSEVEGLLETMETFVESHPSPTAKPLPISKKVQDCFFPFERSELHGEITQAVAWSRKQLSNHGQGPSEDEALDLWQVSAKIRSALERLRSGRLAQPRIQILEQFYGPNWFKCPRINCFYYHQGFSSASQRDYHVQRHERPFLCFVSGCHVSTFGCSKEEELKKHLFEFHGIDMFDEVEFPGPVKSSNKAAKHPATFECHLCPRKFTRRHNLNSHLNTHAGEKPFDCPVCGQSFTRKRDRDRHELGHGDKRFACFGHLKDGNSWGCKSTFSRADKLIEHLRNRRGQNCIRPLLLQKLQDGTTADGDNVLEDQGGPDTEGLPAVGRLLPSFGAFLSLCGLDKASS